ncbi:MAG: Uma2 family endonuclease [Chloroflexales bacterium]|nr:Uma2 family endonuclease [Chloroflexales bacterium]
MSQVIEVVERYILPDFPEIDLPEEDGVPLETNWHRVQINLFVDVVKQHWRDRQDFFAGGNMFIYYSLQQARNRDYKGPDFFVVKEIDGAHDRRKWVVWEENGRYPDVIVELLSPSTAQADLGSKKRIYERTFHTPDYFCYDPDRDQLQGWRLKDTRYESLRPDEHGRLWSTELHAWIGTWEGVYLKQQAVWLRLFDTNGHLIPTESEAEYQRAEAEAAARTKAETRAEAERQRAEDLAARLAAMEDELRRLRGEA